MILKKGSWSIKAIVLLAASLFVFGSFCNVFAQAAQDTQTQVVAPPLPQPPMKNVFFNVLWGSVVGGMLYTSWATIDDEKPEEERYTFNHLTTQFLTGATYGAFIGLGIGVYLSIKGIMFDENLTRIAIFPLQMDETQRIHSVTVGSRKRLNTNVLNLVNVQFKF